MPQLTSVFTRLLLILLSLSLLGCGFKLRGYHQEASPDSISELNLICPNTTNWQLCQSLRQHLKLNDITLKNNADIELRISPINQDSRTLSLQDNAATAEYGLKSSVRYQIVKANTLKVILERTINVQHSYRHESSELLAKEREKTELQAELSQQLAQEIFRQLEILNSKGLLVDKTQTSLLKTKSQP